MKTPTTSLTSLTTRKLTLLAVVSIALARSLSAQVVFSNNFESNTAGFSASGSLSTLGRTSLPTDGGGLASPNQSTWLGRLGEGVAKSGSSDEIITLSLSGLTPGQAYSISFDLLIGASWDGSAGFYGPDSWRLVVDGITLVNTTFSNVQAGVNAGAYSPQRYSDTTYTSTTGADFNRFTGADHSFSVNQNGNYAPDYAIYYFGHGAGNPVLTFTAGGTAAAVQFARYGGTNDSADEYWALDNVQVSVVPEPSALCLLGAGAGLLVLFRRASAKRRP
jgi:hypothetical protein